MTRWCRTGGGTRHRCRMADEGDCNDDPAYFFCYVSDTKLKSNQI